MMDLSLVLGSWGLGVPGTAGVLGLLARWVTCLVSLAGQSQARRRELESGEWSTGESETDSAVSASQS